ncbi:MAG TPA: alpha-ketoglutarate-dependent dioxygenase AlkB, partial [Candidatus Aquilonibacter sp.]
FEADSRVIVDDATGSIVYYPNVLVTDAVARIFEELLAAIPWQSERRMMYDREVDVPRLVASARIDDELTPPLAELVPVVEGIVGVRFTSIGLNLYRDGHDSVAPHNDRLPEIVAGQPIALVSLGATRRMTIRSKATPRRILDLDLAPGSLLVMSYETQFHYDHGIPKTKAEVGPRISVAFRVRT